MADVTGLDLQNATHRLVRATVAAALIESQVVDLSGINSNDPASAQTSTSVTKLKNLIDIVLAGAVYK